MRNPTLRRAEAEDDSDEAKIMRKLKPGLRLRRMGPALQQGGSEWASGRGDTKATSQGEEGRSVEHSAPWRTPPHSSWHLELVTIQTVLTAGNTTAGSRAKGSR